MNARAPIDTDVTLPPAVARAAAAANAAIAAHYPDASLEPQPNPTPTPVPDPQPTPTPQPPSQSAPQPPAEPQPQPAPSDESWEQKFKSVNGRYTRAMNDLNDANARIESLQNVIATMSAAPPAPTPTTTPVAEMIQRVTPEELETFGPEFFAAVGKRAEEVVAPMVAELRQKMAEVDGRLSKTATATVQSAQDRMMATLDERVPPWKEINSDPRFIEWLGRFDAFSGEKRHDLLTAAWNSNNTARVLAFFNGFLSEEAASAQPQPSATTDMPAPEPAPSKVPLESLAAPGRARTAAPSPAPAEKPHIKQSQIQQFYLAVQKGHYKGRDEEKAQFEAQIFQAMAENRIVQG